jgi:TPR repeat protein
MSSLNLLVDQIAILREAAEQGDVYAQYCLGKMYELGHQGVIPNYAEAAEWYRKAAEPKATEEVVFVDIRTAREYRKAVMYGYAEAQWAYGLMFADGRGVAQSEAEAVKWFRRAAEQGHAIAQFTLGGAYASGQGVYPNDTEAMKWYRKAAEQGNADAQNNLGVMLVEDLLVKDCSDAWGKAEAVRWFRMTAVEDYMPTEQGNTVAQFVFDEVHESGYSAAKNENEAVKWLLKAAEQGHAIAQYNLGEIYAKGWRVAQSDAKAAKWYRKAAEQGHAIAQFNLGRAYAKGQGVTQNDAEAVKWFRMSAKQGNKDAQNKLGMMYYQGRGVTKNKIAAVKWLCKAVERGHVVAESNLKAILGGD